MTSAHVPASDAPKDADRLTVQNDPAAIDCAELAVVRAAEARGYPKASLFALRLALHEAIVNAFKHGHKGLSPDLPVTLSYAVKPATIECSIEDRGPGFAPEDVPDPTLEENIERGSGRGLLLIRAYMSEVRFNDKGNRMTMVYARPESA